MTTPTLTAFAAGEREQAYVGVAFREADRR